MKNLKSLNLHRLGQAEMTRKEMNTLTGGDDSYGPYDLPEVYVCGCKCNCPTAGCACIYDTEVVGPDAPYYGGPTIADTRSDNGGQTSWDTASSSGDVPTV